MASTQANDHTSKVITVFFLVVFLVVGYLIAPMFLPVWRWQNQPLEQVSVEKNIPLEQLKEQSFRLYYSPRGKNDPLPFQILVEKTEETPEWEKAPNGEQVDEYQTLVRVEVINDRTGEPPNTTFFGGTRWDKLYRCRGWRLPAGSLGREHARPIILYQGGTFEKFDLGESKSYQPWLQQELRKGNWVSDDDPQWAYEFRHDPFGDRLLYGPTEEELKAEEEARKAEEAEGEGAGDAEAE